MDGSFAVPVPDPAATLVALAPLAVGAATRPAWAIGFLLGLILSAVTVGVGVEVGASTTTLLVLGIPGSFVLGFLVVGFGMSLRR